MHQNGNRISDTKPQIPPLGPGRGKRPANQTRCEAVQQQGADARSSQTCPELTTGAGISQVFEEGKASSTNDTITKPLSGSDFLSDQEPDTGRFEYFFDQRDKQGYEGKPDEKNPRIYQKWHQTIKDCIHILSGILQAKYQTVQLTGQARIEKNPKQGKGWGQHG